MWAMAVVATLAAMLVTSALLVSSHRESVQKQLQATATSLLSLGITRFSELKDFGDLNRFIEDALQMDRVDKIIRVYDDDRKLIFTTAGLDYDVLPGSLREKVKKPVFLTLEGKRRDYESLVLPYVGEGSRRTFYLQVAIPLPRYADVLENLWWQMFLLVAALVGASVVLSHWVSRRLLAPVEQIARHLQGMDPARIDEWKPIELDEGSRYLKGIAEGINLLAERTRVSMGQLRKMSRYVAHEMRTPLTILQGEAEMALARKEAAAADHEAVLRSSLEEISRMSEIVSTVLAVGEMAPTAAGRPEEIDLNAWLVEHLLRWEKTLGRSIELELPKKTIVAEADVRLLSRLVDNLIRNVRTHTPPEAHCAISLADGDRPAIVIADDGPGLSDDVIASLNAHGGFSEAAGVGLNLCHRIAELTGLTLAFANRTGGGLAVTIRF